MDSVRLCAGLLTTALATTSHTEFIDVATFQAGAPTFAAALQEIDVAPHSDGGFVVTWGEFNSTLGPGNRIVTHRFSRSGVETAPPVRIDPIGAREVVRTVVANTHLGVHADYGSRGNLFVVWREYDMTNNVILPGRARAYGSNGGALGPDFAVSAGPVTEIRTTALADDCFATAWYHQNRCASRPATPFASRPSTATARPAP